MSLGSRKALNGWQFYQGSICPIQTPKKLCCTSDLKWAVVLRVQRWPHQWQCEQLVAPASGFKADADMSFWVVENSWEVSRFRSMMGYFWCVLKLHRMSSWDSGSSNTKCSYVFSYTQNECEFCTLVFLLGLGLSLASKGLFAVVPVFC